MIGRHLLRKTFNRAWYSICSMHHDYNKHCVMCHRGVWVNPWLAERRARKFKETHVLKRGEWVARTPED